MRENRNALGESRLFLNITYQAARLSTLHFRSPAPMRFFDLPPINERILLVSEKISDLYFSVGQQLQVEINGKLAPGQPLGMQKLTPYQKEIIALTVMYGNSEASE